MRFLSAVCLVVALAFCSVADAGCGCGRARAVVGAVVERVHNIHVPTLRFRSCGSCQDSAVAVSAQACGCVSGGSCNCGSSCNCSPCGCQSSQSNVSTAPAAPIQICENGVCQVRQVDVWHHGPIASAVRAVASIAQQRAEIAASRRLKGMAGHVGQVSGYFEGVGFSTVSSDAAIRNCCFWGQRTPIEIGVARGDDGWYACVHYR